jgi:hypothetical protein
VRIQYQERPGICWGVIDGNNVKLRAVAPEVWSKLHVTDYDFGPGCERGRAFTMSAGLGPYFLGGAYFETRKHCNFSVAEGVGLRDEARRQRQHCNFSPEEAVDSYALADKQSTAILA